MPMSSTLAGAAAPAGGAPSGQSSTPTPAAATTSTDALDLNVLGLSPAMALAGLYAAAAQSQAINMANATQRARIANASADLAVLGGIMRLYGAGKVGGSGTIETAKADLADLVKLLNSLG